MTLGICDARDRSSGHRSAFWRVPRGLGALSGTSQRSVLTLLHRPAVVACQCQARLGCRCLCALLPIRLAPGGATGFSVSDYWCGRLGDGVPFTFPDWVDLTGIGLMLFLIILVALLWLWWNYGNRP